MVDIVAVSAVKDTGMSVGLEGFSLTVGATFYLNLRH